MIRSAARIAELHCVSKMSQIVDSLTAHTIRSHFR